MTMSTEQGVLWKQIAQTYSQWDPDWNQLMPVQELQDKLPAVPSEMIEGTLAQAKSDGLAELERTGDEVRFKPCQQQ